MIAGRRLSVVLCAAALAVASESCAGSHCGVGEPDGRAPSDAGHLGDAPLPRACAAAEGSLLIGPIVSTAPLTFELRGCSDVVPFRVLVLDPEGRAVRSGIEHCVPGTDYVDLGRLPEGRYQVAFQSDGGASIAFGGSLVDQPACAADPDLAVCAPAEVVVRACDVTVVPALLVCDTVVGSDCAGGA